ncbi:MAG: 4Fe-4S binding protein [Burkholderiales bacterium]|nr:4Fe-4S binding protein [Burkholderiales bacterium]
MQATATESTNSLTDLQAQGWSKVSFPARVQALAALAALPPVEPVASVSYVSKGRLLVLGGGQAGLAAARALANDLDVHVLLPGIQPGADQGFLRWVGVPTSVTGYLGAFKVTWPHGEYSQAEPLPLAQADDEVIVVAAKGQCSGTFDLILDLQQEPAFTMAQPPQGYVRGNELARAGDAAALEALRVQLGDMVGEFEKPKFFAYKSSICARSRSQKQGCSQCIDICSTRAISPDGDHVKVDPHLCMGCGACATVCPSGAMTYQYPRLTDRGVMLRTLVKTFSAAGGANPAVLVHNALDGRDLLAALARNGSGLPENVLPLEAWHVASIGMDALLAAVAYGARHVALLSAGSETAEYVNGLRREMRTAQTVLNALGYAGVHFSVIEASDAAELAQKLSALPLGAVPAVPATFALGNEKRTAIEFSIDHLLKHAPTPQTEVALETGAAFGALKINTSACTMCMACTGACPESALMDSPEEPKLRFLERNCVQCGLCVNTCPENALSLVPRLLLTPDRRREVVLNQAEPFHCIRCDKVLGTKQMIASMLSRLAGHSMFSGEGQLKRLQMCADCRVVDMMENKNEMSIFGADKT